MNSTQAEIFMRCYRADQKRSRDALFLEAIEVARQDENLRPAFEAQLAFDEYANAQIDSLPVPPAVASEIAEMASQVRQGISWRHPAIIAVGVGLLLIAGVLAYFGWQGMDDFDGRDAVESMIERTAGMRGNELEPLNYKVGAIKDWLFMQNLEGFEAPHEFADYHAVGGRVFTQDGYPVVQLAIEENAMIFFLFHEADFDLGLKPGDGWKILTREDWVAAIRGDGQNGFMIAFPGERADIEKVIQSTKK